MLEFNPLNQSEIICLRRAFAHGECSDTLYDFGIIDLNKSVVAYESQGNFTVCTIYIYGCMFSKCLLVGVSHRSNEDKPNEIKGRMLAFKRAITMSKGVYSL